MKNTLMASLAFALSLAAVPAHAVYGIPTPVLTCTSDGVARENSYTVTIFENGQDSYAELYWNNLSGQHKVLTTPVAVKMYRCMPNTRCLNSPTYYNSDDLNLTVQPRGNHDEDSQRGELVAEVNGQRVVEQVRCIRPMHVL